MNLLSLVVPCFNEEETLAYTHERLCAVLNSPEWKDLSKFEIVYVNDGSRDQTAAILNQFAASSSDRIQVQALHFARNFGHSNAVLAGLQEAKGNFIAIIDADLQDPPELLIPMFAELLAGQDVVYGQRRSREAESLFKKFSAWAFYRLLGSLTGFAIPKDTGDFRIIRREVLEALLACGEQNPFLRGLVAWVGFRQKAFPYDRQARKFGTTKYPLRKMIKFASQAILSFSTAPLKIAIYLAFFTFVLSLGIIVWALVVHTSGYTVPGWTSMVVAFLMGQSMTLFVMGVIGLYIGQIHVGVQNRPRYILKRGPQ